MVGFFSPTSGLAPRLELQALWAGASGPPIRPPPAIGIRWSAVNDIGCFQGRVVSIGWPQMWQGAPVFATCLRSASRCLTYPRSLRQTIHVTSFWEGVGNRFSRCPRCVWKLALLVDTQGPSGQGSFAFSFTSAIS